MVSIPISSNQVVDVPVDLKCLTASCQDLNGVLQAIIDKVCAPVDFDSLDFDCLTPVDNFEDLFQQLITKVCEPDLDTGITFDYNLLEMCASDTWLCGESSCLTVENPCDPGNIIIENVLQTLISRVVTLTDKVTELCDRIDTLEANYTALEVRVTQIENSCCQ